MKKLKKCGSGVVVFLLVVATFLYFGNAAGDYKSEQYKLSAETQGVSDSGGDSDFVRSMEKNRIT